MMFYKKYFVGLLFCLALIVTPIGSKFFDKDSQLNAVNAAIPAAAAVAGLLLASGPAGWVLGGLGIIHVVSVLLIDKQDDADDTSLKNLDLLQVQSGIINEINKVDKHVLHESARIIGVLAHKIESHALMEEMRSTLEYFKTESAKELSTVMNSKIPASAKESTINLMTNPHSAYRQKLRYFITKFIKSNIRVPATEKVELFFEFVLQMDHLLAIDNENGYTESMHTQVLKAYMFIAIILTDAYVMPIAAHVIQYQDQINQRQLSSASHTKNVLKNLINDYNNDMKALIGKTRSTLKKTSREIRNSGTFSHYVKGHTFDFFDVSAFKWRNCSAASCYEYYYPSAGISTEPVVALPGNVITGVRFRMHEGILYIDIQQGKFQDMLSVVPGSVFWTMTPAGGSYENLGSYIQRLELGNWESLKSNSYLTGIQLRKGQNDYNGVITVHMFSSEIPFISSKPIISYPLTEYKELKLTLEKLDDPTRGSLKNLISPAPHEAQRYFMVFRCMSLKTNFVQSVPFIDTREVISDPPAPMKGFGIYHEAGADSVGFIALKLISPELTQFVNYAQQIGQFTNSTEKD